MGGRARRLALVPVPGRPRVDKRGRRIGYNWWREYNCTLLLDATLAWDLACERVAMGYATEMAEYAEDFPKPTLKAFLLANKGINSQPEEAVA